MSVSAEMYIVISLMFAVFAAVAAIGTSVVLGAGFERLRAGFEIVKKQTGFFADAIHQLDERTKMLDAQSNAMKESVSSMSVRVERVEKQTGFFADAINSIEGKILQGSPTQKVETYSTFDKPIENKTEKPISPPIMNWASTLETGRLLQKSRETMQAAPQITDEIPSSSGLSSLFVNYLRSEGRRHDQKEVVYH